MRKILSKVTINPNYPEVYDVDPTDVETHKNKLCLIDVRTNEEFTGELGHAPGSKLLTLDHLPERINELSKDRCIVFICRSGGRSSRAADFAQKQGFLSVFNMKGGMLLWNELELETE